MEFKSIMHVTFFTNRLDVMVRFYTEVLGGEVKILTRAKAHLDRPDSAYHQAALADPEAVIIVYVEIAPGQFVELFPGGPQQPPHRQWNDSVDYSHFAVLVDDLHATMERLGARCLTFDTGPSYGPAAPGAHWAHSPSPRPSGRRR